MPEVTIIEISQEQQEWMLRVLRRSRYGYLLALHILLLLVRGKTPTEIADFLLCSRASVYRAKAAWADGTYNSSGGRLNRRQLKLCRSISFNARSCG